MAADRPICPACRRPLERLRATELGLDAASDALRSGVVVALSCPHCAVTISAQILSALS